jgi:hypothetical protein
MQPSFWSKTKFSAQKIGWHQCSESKVVYEASPYSDTTNEKNFKYQKDYMQLSFSYTFESGNDEVFCAYTIPYNYT